VSNRTLLDAFESFENSCDKKNISLFKSALFSFTLPGLGGQTPSGSRITSKERDFGRKILNSISISATTEEQLREAQKQTFARLNTPKERQRQLKSYLNQFIEWAIKSRFFPSLELPEENEEYTFYPKKIHRVKSTNRVGETKKFTFSFEPNDYINEPLTIEQIQQHLNRIKEELNKFESYKTNNLGKRAVTGEKYTRLLQRILGWLYREKNIPLAEFSLNKLVPFVKLNPRLSKFSNNEGDRWLSQVTARAEALEEIKDKAHSLVDLMMEFFSWLDNPPSSRTKQHYITSLIEYSKYVYHSETDKTMALNFEDIPIVNRLKVFQHEVDTGKKNASSHSSNKYLPWPDVINILEKMKFEADLETIKCNGAKKRPKRLLLSTAKSLQKFVLLGFFILVPPPRQRVVRELELGRTLKYGLFKNGRFIPVDAMINPSEARYYIHLQPQDYKTGDTYGEWLGEFPNVEFDDGSKFYDYVNRWLFQGYQDKGGEWHGMRDLVAAAGEKTVVVGSTLGRSYKQTSMGNLIRRIFIRWTGVPVNPQELRHLYRTYIDDPATGASEAEKESAAFWMRHSSQMAKKVYSHLNCEQKLQMGAQMSERLNRQLLIHKK